MSVVEGWKSFDVEQCCEILDSKRVPVNGEDREKRIGEIPYYGANGLQGYIDDFIFDEPLILIAEDGGCFDEFATRPIAYRIRGKSWVNNHAHVLRAKKEFDQDAIFYNLEHKDIQSFIVGGTRSKLNQSALRAINFSLPTSKPEQTKIAEILSTVDRAIEQTEALIAKQQRIKTGLMQDLLNRGIDEHGNLRSEETHEFKDSPLGRIPVEWEVKQSSDLMNILNGGTPSTSNKEYWTGGTIPWLSVEDFNNSKRFVKSTIKHITSKGMENSAAIILPKYSIIISARGTVGVISQLSCDMSFNQSCYGLISKNVKTLSNHFLYYSLKQIFAGNGVATSGSVFETITRQTFDEILIPFPQNNEEADSIVDVLSQQDILIEEMRDNLSKLRSVKTALMQDLLTGMKRVTTLLEKEQVAGA